MRVSQLDLGSIWRLDASLWTVVPSSEARTFAESQVLPLVGEVVPASPLVSAHSQSQTECGQLLVQK